MMTKSIFATVLAILLVIAQKIERPQRARAQKVEVKTIVESNRRTGAVTVAAVGTTGNKISQATPSHGRTVAGEARPNDHSPTVQQGATVS